MNWKRMWRVWRVVGAVFSLLGFLFVGTGVWFVAFSSASWLDVAPMCINGLTTFGMGSIMWMNSRVLEGE